jgi:isocitrate dehydrogenase (NAD+)
VSLRVTLIQGGGTGLDQVPAVKRILAAAGVAIDWDEQFGGLAALERKLPPVPVPTLESVRATGLALKTSLLAPPGLPPRKEGAIGNWNVQFRRELGLFASVRPLKNLAGLPARFRGVDILLMRELTEDLYAAIEHEIVPGVVQSLKVVTESARPDASGFIAFTRPTSSSWPTACFWRPSAVSAAISPSWRRRKSSSITAACRWCPGRHSLTW